jgi:xanthine dehydrogenase YagR molybdenum-binding subunit
MKPPLIGRRVHRVDGVAKVTGAARYAAEFNQPHQAYAVVVTSTIALGYVRRIDTESILRLPGVLAVITHHNAPRLPYRAHKSPVDPESGRRLDVLQSGAVRFFGQPVAVVVANTLEDAEHAAAALRVDYSATLPVVDAQTPKAVLVVPDTVMHPSFLQTDKGRGGADGAMTTARVAIEATYDMARENHNPMEPHATVASWDGNHLTLWSKSQYLVNESAEIAAIFGLRPENVLVICPFVGGGFGTSLRTWPHVTLAAVAARVVARPVKLVLTRRQMFFMTGHRPRTIQRVALGANLEGQLTTLIHEGTAETSRYEQFVEPLTSASRFMYSCSNVRTRQRIVPLDISTPCHMRGPGFASGIFAIECAMDELAYALRMDPIELRRRNEPRIDEGESKPFSSRSLMKCFDVGVERFGWARRDPQPRSMRDGRLLIGWGTAAAGYPAFFSAASARARLLADGSAEVEAAASDMGPGTYTALTQVAADFLDLPLERVRVNLGRSDLPPTPPHGGSMTLACVGSAVQAACVALKADIIKRAIADRLSPLFGAKLQAIEWHEGRLALSSGAPCGVSCQDVVLNGGGSPIEATASVVADTATAARFSMHAFGAVFAEVAVDPDVGTVRVRRAMSVYGAGRIINPLLATSQCIGGMVGGIGMALLERTVLDPRDGRPVNAHLADYLVPINLDVPDIDVHFIDENDPHVNPLGAKGLGEIAFIGTAPAIANAVFHATGKRVRELPIRVENLIDTWRPVGDDA